jgi:hypothetical protein
MAEAGGRSQAEERLGAAATILMITCRQKAMYGGLFSDSKIMSVPGVEHYWGASPWQGAH